VALLPRVDSADASLKRVHRSLTNADIRAGRGRPTSTCRASFGGAVGRLEVADPALPTWTPLGWQETTTRDCDRPHDIGRGDSRQRRPHSRGGTTSMTTVRIVLTPEPDPTGSETLWDTRLEMVPNDVGRGDSRGRRLQSRAGVPPRYI
jgi:hypothetical protein